MGKISKTETVYYETNDSMRLLERATNFVTNRAINIFGIDECGHSSKVKDWARSCCCIKAKFEGIEMLGGMTGWSFVAKFSVWCEKTEEDE